MRSWRNQGMTVSTEEEGIFQSLDDLQERFAEALRRGDERVLSAPGIVAGNEESVVFAKRFAVYRNNIYHSLSQALLDVFPVVTRLVGEAFFSAMARAYLDSGNFPVRAPLYDFGDSFPGFMERFPPAKKLPWLGDVARVERAWLSAYHGADPPGNTAFDPGFLSIDNMEETVRMALMLHPSLEVAALRWPAVGIWQAHQQSNTEERLERMRIAEQENFVVAVRGKEQEVRVASLPGYVGGILERLRDGERVLEAVCGIDEDGVRLVLGTLFEMGAVLGLESRP